jgi:MerR family transcriptional regulator, light-induced transcriptional regulator
MLNLTLAQKILDNQDKIAVEAVTLIYENQKDLIKNYQDQQKNKSIRDTKYHLNYLAEAIEADSKSLFLDYIEWAAVIMENIGIDLENFIKNLLNTRDAIAEYSDEKELEILNDFFYAAVNNIRSNYKRPLSFLVRENSLYQTASSYLEFLLNSDRHSASKLILQSVEAGVPVKDIYQEVFQPVQREIGRLWQINKISVAQEHFCSAATQLVMSQLYPYIFSTRKNGKRFIAASVGNELHEIGLRMVADFFEMAGWDTYYFGANTPSESIIDTIKQINPHLIGLSTTITYNLKNLKELIKAIKAEKFNLKTKIIVGGYPFITSPDLWKKVGADGYAPDAENALKFANNSLH